MSSFAPRLLASLRQSTLDLLAPLGLLTQPLPAELAQAGSPGRMQLTAECWLVGWPEPLAELRLVTILGQASEIHNAWLFPAQPAVLPVFASEILVFGRRPRLAFIDVQAPTLHPDLLPQLVAALTTVQQRYQHCQCSEQPPAWATHGSTGAWLYARTDEPTMLPALLQAYRDYLAVWLNFAQLHSKERDLLITPSDDRYMQYKRNHATHTPGRIFLAKVFGQVWTESFFEQFLYR